MKTTEPLPVIDLLNDVTTIQGYLRAVAVTTLPTVITGDPQHASLVTQYNDWNSNLWAEFWEGLLSANITAQSQTINNLFNDGVNDIGVMHDVLYYQKLIRARSVCNSLADLVSNGQSLLSQLETIAEGIEDADKEAVAKFTALAKKLDTQFSAQEDELTQKVISTGVEVVITSIDLAVAIGTEGEDIEPLVKGVIKIGEDVIDELQLTDEINATLGDLESAWSELDQASSNLAQITLTCRQLKAVTDDASAVLNALQSLSDKWATVAAVTNDSAEAWADSGSAALQTWAAEMRQISFGYASQAISGPQATA